MAKASAKLFLIAGPNGAGKSTFAQGFLEPWVAPDHFLNADDMARELVPTTAERTAFAAGRLLLEKAQNIIDLGENFAIETTGASRLTNLVQYARDHGYRIKIIYLWLNDPLLAIARVANRVKEGGHDIPRDVILRRYRSGAVNLAQHYLTIADTVMVYDNSGPREELVLIKDKSALNVYNEAIWAAILELIDGNE